MSILTEEEVRVALLRHQRNAETFGTDPDAEFVALAGTCLAQHKRVAALEEVLETLRHSVHVAEYLSDPYKAPEQTAPVGHNYRTTGRLAARAALATLEDK